jgi:hypothetical protein
LSNGETIVAGAVVGEDGEDGEDGADLVACDHDYYALNVKNGSNKLVVMDNPATTDVDERETFCYAEVYACSKCSDIISKNVTAHNYNAPQTVAPTCTEEGYTAKVCKDCGFAVEKTDIKDPLDHNWGAERYTTYEGGPVANLYTICENGGFKVTKCTRCDLVKSEPFGGEGHIHNWKKSVDPTKAATGKLVSKCEFCSNTIEHTLPKLDNINYDFSYDTEEGMSCLDIRTGTYVYTIENANAEEGFQTFEFSAPESKKHVIEGYGEFNINEIQNYVDIKDYVTIAADYTVSCSSTNIALGVGYCKDCSNGVTPLIVKVKEYHTIPENAVVAVKADCETDGSYAVGTLCKVCNEGITTAEELRIAKRGHEFDYYLVDKGNDKYDVMKKCLHTELSAEEIAAGLYKACTYTPTLVAANVTDFTEEIITPATCGVAGKKTVSFVHNGETLSVDVTIPALVHEHATLGNHLDLYTYSGEKILGSTSTPAYGLNWSVYKNTEGLEEAADDYQATCDSAQGKAVYTCKNCSKPVLVDIYVPHTRPTDTTLITQPTCTTAGQYNCTKCNKDIEIVALDHDLVVDVKWVDQAQGTCNIVKKCSRCDYIEYLKDDNTWTTVEAEKGLFNATGSITKPATCIEEGVKTWTITPAGATTPFTVTTPVAKINHTLNGKVLEEDKISVGTPGFEVAADQVPACSDTSADCKGVFTCEFCNKPVIYTAYTEHTDDGTTRTNYQAPTCEQDGGYDYTCTKCGSAEHENLTKLGHETVSITVVKKPTATELGQAKVICVNENCDKNAGGEGLLIDLPVLSDSAYVKTPHAGNCVTLAYTEYKYELVSGTHTWGFAEFVIDADNYADHDFVIDGRYDRYVWSGVDVKDGNTYTYVGFLCKNCNKVIITKKLADKDVAWAKANVATPAI